MLCGSMGGWACGRVFFSHTPTHPYNGQVYELMHGSVSTVMEEVGVWRAVFPHGGQLRFKALYVTKLTSSTGKVKVLEVLLFDGRFAIREDVKREGVSLRPF